MACRLGLGLVSQFSPFRYFPNFSKWSKQQLLVWYQVHIWQVSPQLSCRDTRQIWTWLKVSDLYFCYIKFPVTEKLTKGALVTPTTGWHQAITCTNAGILLIRTLGTIFSEILSAIHTFLFMKMHLKMLSGKWRPLWVSLNVLKQFRVLTHWGRVMHICISKLTISGSDNGLLHGQHQAIIQTNSGILLIRPLGPNFNKISISIHTFTLKKSIENVIWEMASILTQP